MCGEPACQDLGHSVLLVGGGDQVSGSQHLWGGVGHGHTETRGLEHRDVVGAVSKGDHILGGQSQSAAQCSQGHPLGGPGGVQLQITGHGDGLDQLWSLPPEQRHDLRAQLQVREVHLDLLDGIAPGTDCGPEVVHGEAGCPGQGPGGLVGDIVLQAVVVFPLHDPLVVLKAVHGAVQRIHQVKDLLGGLQGDLTAVEHLTGLPVQHLGAVH